MSADPVDKNVERQALIAVAVAIAEQLDTERFLTALKRQHDAYAQSDLPDGGDIALLLFEIGNAVHQVDALKESKKTASH